MSGDAGRERRSVYLQQSDFERAEEWCRLVRAAFPNSLGLFLVGSVHERPDFRDVDLRLMLDDDDFDRKFSNGEQVRMFNRAFSAWGQRDTGLPIDFQIQRMTEANAEFPGGARNSMGTRRWSAIGPSGTPWSTTATVADPDAANA